MIDSDQEDDEKSEGDLSLKLSASESKDSMKLLAIPDSFEILNMDKSTTEN